MLSLLVALCGDEEVGFVDGVVLCGELERVVEANAFVTVDGTVFDFRSDLRRLLIFVEWYCMIRWIEVNVYRHTVFVLFRLRVT